jgi:uncharacterized surface protein with fasciclin (FAS1) repeats
MPGLVETAVKSGNFQTLLKFVEATNLVEILNSPGPYTIFAPTDEAFAQISKETLDALVQDTTKLRRIIAYHIVSGDVRSDDLVQIDEAPTVEGSVLAIESTNGKIKVNDATVLQTDILTDNGVIHVIDKVLIPAIVPNE